MGERYFSGILEELDDFRCPAPPTTQLTFSCPMGPAPVDLFCVVLHLELMFKWFSICTEMKVQGLVFELDSLLDKS